MSYSEFFPFLLESRVIREFKIPRFNFTDPRYVSFNNSIQVTNKSTFDKLLNSTGISNGAYVSLTRVVPNDIYIYTGNDEAVEAVLNSSDELLRSVTINAIITDLDYGRLSDFIEFTNSNSIAVMRHGSDYESQEVKSTKFVKDAQSNVSSNIDEFLDYKTESYFTEDAIDDIFKGLNQTVGAPVEMDPPFYEVIKNYLKSDTKTEKIPLLVGMSGIAKSAMVKGLANDLNMRLVDLRVSFMSRLDIDGLSEIVGKEIGEPMTINAPMVEFLTCTDEYIDFSRKVVPVLKQALDNINDDDPNAKKYRLDLSNAISKFEESSKIPVLFFDEITRSDKSIRGALTTIINQRLYGKYHLNYARMIAATNAPVGYEDDDDMNSLFLGATLEDVAVLDRFNKIVLTPEEVYPNWIKWAKGHLNPLVYDYVKENPDRAYDITPAVDKAHDYDREDELIPPYPTYRAWENISDYINTIVPDNSGNKFYNEDIIKGLLGTYHGNLFINFLESNGYERKYKDVDTSSRDELTDFISDSLDAGLPTMVMGVSGLGKTTRIREYCEKNGYDFELVSLSTKDRLDIMGPPAKVDITRYIAKETSVSLDELGLMDKLQALKDESGLPNSVTLRSPNKDLQNRIEASERSGKKLVLFFDEFNRCIDPTVQSSIFQAISDNSFGGVKFKPGQVKVALAGNLGDSTREAGRVDGALTARAVQYKKMSYDEKDARAVLNYMKSHNYAQPLLDFLGDDTNKVLKLISSVDEGSLTSNVSSTRSLKALSDMLINNKESKRLHGALLCPNDTDVQEFNFNYYDDKVFWNMVKRIQSRIGNWAALGSVDYPGGTDLNTAIDIFNRGVEALNSVQSGSPDFDKLKDNLVIMITNFLAIDQSISSYRKKSFGYFVDADFADEFTEYYNLNSGLDGSVGIEDLTNESLIPKYVVQEYTKLNAALPGWYLIVKTVYDYFGTNLLNSAYEILIESCIDNDTSVENSRSEMKKVIADPNLESIILEVEQNYRFEDTYKRIVKKLGYTEAEYLGVSGAYVNTPGVI